MYHVSTNSLLRKGMFGEQELLIISDLAIGYTGPRHPKEF